jgi:hypothetical protein
MYSLFKKIIKETQPQKPEPPKVNPAYEQFVSNEEVAKLKIALVKSISEVEEAIASIPEYDKKRFIQCIISKIPSKIKVAYLDRNKLLYLYGSYIDGDARKYGGTDNVFKIIADDLYAILYNMGTNPTLSADKSYISFKTDDLRQFCNYEKLVLLK